MFTVFSFILNVFITVYTKRGNMSIKILLACFFHVIGLLTVIFFYFWGVRISFINMINTSSSFWIIKYLVLIVVSHILQFFFIISILWVLQCDVRIDYQGKIWNGVSKWSISTGNLVFHNISVCLTKHV